MNSDFFDTDTDLDSQSVVSHVTSFALSFSDLACNHIVKMFVVPGNVQLWLLKQLFGSLLTVVIILSICVVVRFFST